MTMDRRDFLKSGVVATATIAAATLAAGGSAVGRPAKAEFKISLAEWSFHKALFAGQMDHLDFPKVAKNDYGISAVEYVNQFFPDKAKDMKYLGEMKKRAQDNGVESRLIMIDGEGDLGDADEAKRTTAVENHYKWVDAAKFLGCKMIRVNARSTGTYEEQVSRCADGLHRLTEYGAKAGLYVIVENHGGLSSNGKWVVELMKKVNHPKVGTLPDFGNFDGEAGAPAYDRYLGTREMMPYARAVSAKTFDFDAAGNETTIDYVKMLKIVFDGGYHSFLGIEFEGDRMSEPDGVKASKALLDRLRGEL